MFPAAPLSDLPAFCADHDACAGTGCTVVVAPEGAVCGVDVRGGGPATRETDLLKPENMIEAVHAVVLSGGSAFGLEASCGVMDALAERGIGFPVGTARVPIVVGACLFDLLIGDPVHPDKAMGRFAAECAHLRRTDVGRKRPGLRRPRRQEKPPILRPLRQRREPRGRRYAASLRSRRGTSGPAAARPWASWVKTRAP